MSERQGHKYYDSSAARQVIGCILNDPALLTSSGEYTLTPNDFANEFHKVMMGCISNLILSGAKVVNRQTIEEYLEDGHENSKAIYKVNHGDEWLHQVFLEAEPMNFRVNYNQLKKMSLLRTYAAIGVDLDWLYDPDNMDVAEIERQRTELEQMSLEEIADMVDNRILRVRELVIDNDTNESCNIGDDIDGLIQRLKDTPVRGYRLWDSVTNKIALGARLGTFYLRSASTGVGKSRSSMADACGFACGEVYDPLLSKWVDMGEKIPTVFISVELDKEELQTMALAFIGGIPEDRILQPDSLNFQEEERLVKAAKILRESELYIEHLPDYSLKDIENCIKRNIRINKVQCICMDYITTSMSMLEEIARATKGMKMREDQVLFQFSSKLKDIAQQYGVFILSSTQLSANFKTEKIPDQTLLAGAKAIANRIDFGSIMLDVTPEDIEDLNNKGNFIEKYGTPNVKCSIYKNRRGKYNRVLLWMWADKSICRYETIFVTDYMLNDKTEEIAQLKG